MNYPKVRKVEAVDDHTLLVEFDNCDRRLYDATQLFERKEFSPLTDLAFFIKVRVDTGGYGIFWNHY